MLFCKVVCVSMYEFSNEFYIMGKMICGGGSEGIYDGNVNLLGNIILYDLYVLLLKVLSF